MATHLRVFRLASTFGKRSLLFKIKVDPISKQTCMPLSTTACCQDAVKKLIPNEAFLEKNVRMQRPMSPHITIYKFELPALLSGSHRATGFALSGVIAAVGVGSLILPGSPSSYIDLIKTLDLPLWFLAPGKFLLVWPVVYHTFNGVRHLIWDTGRGFQMKTLYKSGYLVAGSSILAALGIVAYLSTDH